MCHLGQLTQGRAQRVGVLCRAGMQRRRRRWHSPHRLCSVCWASALRRVCAVVCYGEKASSCCGDKGYDSEVGSPTPQGEGQFLGHGAFRLPVLPGSAGCGARCRSWPHREVLANAGGFAELPPGSHASPCPAATGNSRVPRGVPTLCVPSVPCVYILIYGAYNRLNASAAALRLGAVPWSFAVLCLCRCLRACAASCLASYDL